MRGRERQAGQGGRGGNSGGGVSGGAVYFYHLTRTPLEATLPLLLEKALRAGWKVLVRGRDRARLDWLDRRLWLGPEEEFLPHGLAGGPHDAAQPVLLSAAADNPFGAEAVIAVDGAPLSPAEVRRAQRAMVLFDGADAAAVEHARGQWAALTEAGCRAQYWSQGEDGGWEKKAEA